MTRWLLYTVGLPTVIQGYIVGAVFLTLRLVERPHIDSGVFCAWWRPGVQKRWNYATTLGGFIAKPSWWSLKIKYHEFLHVEQYLLLNLLGAIQAAVLVPWLSWWAFLWWGSSGILWLAPNYIASVVEHKRPGVSWFRALYHTTAHEQWAYSETKAKFDGVNDPWEASR